MKKFILLLSVILFCHALYSGKISHGNSIYGTKGLKYKPGETYEHANKSAPKGGTITLSTLGSFTKLNPYSLKGTPAQGLGLVFENLADGSQDSDEPFSQYGLIAEKFELADDHKSIIFHINKKAAFSDKHPLTADDVVFSFNLISNPEYHPFYKAYYRDVEKAEKIDDYTVKFVFRKYNQELPMIVGQLPILPKHIYGMEGKKFGEDFDEIAIGSGPYIVDSFDRGSHITLKRNPEYWGKELPVNRGRYNFDKIIYKIFLSPIPEREALKGGQIDAQQISSSKDWAMEFNGKYVKNNYIKKATFSHNRVSGMQCYVFNLRDSIFRDINVRKAISAVFDFDNMNKNLFYNQYKRQTCFFDNNKEMMSRGPAEGEVREILLSLRKKYGKKFVPKDAITRGPYTIGTLKDGSEMSIKDRIQVANSLLDKDGYVYNKGLGVREKDGKLLKFEILIHSSGWEKIVNPFIERLAEIGIKATYRLVQPAEYMKKVKKFDFDMIVYTFGQSMSPGNEQRDSWTSKAASVEGSRNVIGIQNPAIDDIVERLIGAKNRKELLTYVKVLDRILCANFYVIPQWYIDYDRAIYWNRFSGPEKYASKTYFISNFINWWWFDKEKDQKLKKAKESETKLVD